MPYPVKVTLALLIHTLVLQEKISETAMLYKVIIVKYINIHICCIK